MNGDRLTILHWAGCVFLIGAVLLTLHGARIDIRTPDTIVSIALF